MLTGYAQSMFIHRCYFYICLELRQIKIMWKFFGMININLNFVTVSTDSNQLITVTVWQKQSEVQNQQKLCNLPKQLSEDSRCLQAPTQKQHESFGEPRVLTEFDVKWAILFNEMINQQINMGHAYVHPQYSNTQQDTLTTADHSPLKSDKGCGQPDKDDILREEPIYIPSMSIKQSPFKNIGFRGKEPSDKCSTDFNYQQQMKHSEQKTEEENLAVKQSLWNSVLYDTKIFGIIANMLGPKDRISLSSVSPRINTQVYIYQLFHRSNNWDLTFHTIENKILTRSQFSFTKMLNQFINQQSEHSLDLERLQTFFLPDSDMSEQLHRVDKVMKAINYRGIPYFQGLNSIVVILISFFTDQVSYEVACELIDQTENIHDKPQVYMQVLQKIEKEVKEKCPNVYEKLEKFDLGVEYFAMKWVMGLFSTDLTRGLVICFWDLVLTFGLNSLVWFVVAVFMALQAKILKLSESDQLNHLLKNQLKDILIGEKANNILQNTRVMISEQLFGRGCSEVFKPWSSFNQYCLEKQFGHFCHGMRKLIPTINEQQVEYQICQTEVQDRNEKQTHYETFRSERELEPVKQDNYQNYPNEPKQTINKPAESESIKDNEEVVEISQKVFRELSSQNIEQERVVSDIWNKEQIGKQQVKQFKGDDCGRQDLELMEELGWESSQDSNYYQDMQYMRTVF